MPIYCAMLIVAHIKYIYIAHIFIMCVNVCALDVQFSGRTFRDTPCEFEHLQCFDELRYFWDKSFFYGGFTEARVADTNTFFRQKHKNEFCLLVCAFYWGKEFRTKWIH